MSIKVNALPVEAAPLISDSTINDSGNLVTKRTTWQKVFDLFVATGIMNGTYLSGIAAAGANQATATALTNNMNRIDTVALGTGVKNAVTEPAGFTRTVQNNGANDLLWYPFGANSFYEIGGVGLIGASTPIIIAPGNQASVMAYTAGVLTLK